MNNSDAMVNLGVCYFNGTGVKQNEEKAVELYSKAAEMNHSSAMYNLGYCYSHGRGVNQNEEKAVEFYRLAATFGSIKAKEYLSSISMNKT